MIKMSGLSLQEEVKSVVCQKITRFNYCYVLRHALLSFRSSPVDTENEKKYFQFHLQKCVKGHASLLCVCKCGLLFHAPTLVQTTFTTLPPYVCSTSHTFLCWEKCASHFEGVASGFKISVVWSLHQHTRHQC